MEPSDPASEDRQLRLREDLEIVLAKGVGDFDPSAVSLLAELCAKDAVGNSAKQERIRVRLSEVLDPRPLTDGDAVVKPQHRDRNDRGLAGLFMFGALGEVTFPATKARPAMTVNPSAYRKTERLELLAELRGGSRDDWRRTRPWRTRTLYDLILDDVCEVLLASPSEAIERSNPVVPLTALGEDDATASTICVDVETGGDVTGHLAAQAYRLGVRRSPAAAAFGVPSDGSTDQVRLSRYVTRETLDQPLCTAISNTFGQGGVHVIALDGFSYTGKSRALLQALMRQRRRFRFLAPHTVPELAALLDGPSAEDGLVADRPTMLWLDPLEGFAEQTSGAWLGERLAQHSDRVAPVVLLAGHGGTAGVPMDAATRRFLQVNDPLDLMRDLSSSSTLTLREMSVGERGFEARSALDVIRGTYDATASSRPGPWETAAQNGGFLRALAHGGGLQRRYTSGWPDAESINPRGQAVAWAVMAWRRAIQSDAPIDVETIERLHLHSPLGSRGHIGSASELDAAIDWACQFMPDDASRLISPVLRANEAQAFRAEAFLAHALVRPHELTDSVWAIIESAEPAHDRLVIVRHGRNAIAIQSHGSPSPPATIVDVEPRRPFGSRGPGDGSAHEHHAVHGMAFRTTSALEGRIRDTDCKVELMVWSDPSAPLVANTVVVSLNPISPSRPALGAGLPDVVIAQSDDGYWQLTTELSAPRTEQDWRALAKSLRIATISK